MKHRHFHNLLVICLVSCMLLTAFSPTVFADVSSAETQSFIITLTSSQNGATSGSGTYTNGQYVILGAKPDPGYNFNGWYEGDTKISVFPNYSFVAQRDMVLTPRFVLLPSSYLELTTVGNGSVILNGTTSCNGNYKSAYPWGTSILLTATAQTGNVFAYWEDIRTSTILSTEPVYESIMGSGISLKAVFSKVSDPAATQYNVAFQDRSGKILKSTGVTKATDAIPPRTQPTLVGYRFIGWDQDFNNIASDKTITASFARLSNLYSITVTNGTLSTGETGGNYRFDTPVTINADTATAGHKFSHWEQDGVRISTKNPFTFLAPMRSTTLNAIFGDEKSQLNEYPSICLAPEVLVDRENSTMLFTVHKNLTQEYKLVESGVLLQQSKSTISELSVDNTIAIHAKIKDNASDTFYIRKSNIEATETWYGRAYLMYRDGSNIVTVYSQNTVQIKGGGEADSPGSTIIANAADVAAADNPAYPVVASNADDILSGGDIGDYTY